MNGRVERFFGTLKKKLNSWTVGNFEMLNMSLAEFSVWYNHVRPHWHLAGRTPAEVWENNDPFAHAPKRVEYFTA